MLHITCHYSDFIIIYNACLAHLNARCIHLNTFSTSKKRHKHGAFIILEACTKVSRLE